MGESTPVGRLTTENNPLTGELGSGHPSSHPRRDAFTTIVPTLPSHSRTSRNGSTVGDIGPIGLMLISVSNQYMGHPSAQEVGIVQNCKRTLAGTQPLNNNSNDIYPNINTDVEADSCDVGIKHKKRSKPQHIIDLTDHSFELSQHEYSIGMNAHCSTHCKHVSKDNTTLNIRSCCDSIH